MQPSPWTSPRTFRPVRNHPLVFSSFAFLAIACFSSATGLYGNKGISLCGREGIIKEDHVDPSSALTTHPHRFKHIQEKVDTQPSEIPTKMASPDKEIVLITGGNGGIGREIARQILRDHGQRFHVLIGCRKLADGEAAVEELQGEGHGVAVEAVQLDITDEGSLAAAAKLVGDRFGRLDVLHANVSRPESIYISHTHTRPSLLPQAAAVP